MKTGQVNTRADLRISEPVVGVVLGLAGYRDGASGYVTPITIAINQAFFSGSAFRILGAVGDLMESVVITSHSAAIRFMQNKGLDSQFLKVNRFLIHIAPLYEIKDGPSIGLAIMSAFISLAINKSPKASIAVTGEVDLNANVLPVGLIDSKLQGALSVGVSRVIYPENSSDVIFAQITTPQQQQPNTRSQQQLPNTATYHSVYSANSLGLIVVNRYDKVYDILFE